MTELWLGPPFSFPGSAGLILTAQKYSSASGKKRCPFALALAAFSIKINLTMKAISREKNGVCVFSCRMNMKEKSGKTKPNKCKKSRLSYVTLSRMNINGHYPCGEMLRKQIRISSACFCWETAGKQCIL